jgi:hypothetical protein
MWRPTEKEDHPENGQKRERQKHAYDKSSAVGESS